jgi:ribosomal protein S18 acetylase RimI-like enzyme
MSMNDAFRIEPARTEDAAAVIALWERCGLVVAHNPPLQDFQFALGKANSDVLAGRLDGEIVASVMVGHDGHRGWIYYLAVDPAHQRHGFGELLVRAAESWLRERQVRKLQLMVRDSNQGVLEFYRGIGYERSPVTVMQHWLDQDDTESR